MGTVRLTAGAWALAAFLAAGPVAAVPLWEVEGAAGGRVLLLGSVHFLRPGDYPLPEPVDAALAEADRIYLEIDLDDPAATSPATLTALAIDPDGRRLPELLGEREYATASRQARAVGLDLAPLAAFEPWYAALAVTQLRLAQLGFAGDQGVEQYVVREAAAAGIEIRGLETLADQLAALDGLSPAAQKRFLAATLEEAASLDDEAIGGIISAWRDSDTDALEDRMLADLESQPEVYRRVVVLRNEHFLKQVRSLLRGRETVLVVVGTLHLIGDDGLVAGLRAAGFTPRAID
jgi:uncharacterized protein